MKEKLQKIFAKKLSQWRCCRNGCGRCSSKTREQWIKCLSSFGGINRHGKLLNMIIPCPADQIEFTDPFGEEVVIRINKELALKIITLGYLPANGDLI